MDAQEEQQNRAWASQWRENATLLDEIKRRELRALTEEEAGRLFAAMTSDPDLYWISPERAGAAGMIEQQRIFLRSHEHPARHRRRP